MAKIVVYWSQTGNTESMANKIAEELGCEAVNVSTCDVASLKDYDTVVLGCPAMGAEELEEDEFRPFFEQFMAEYNNQKLGLFGSFGWGGDWLDSWKDETEGLGGNVVATIKAMGDADAFDSDELNAFVSSLN